MGDKSRYFGRELKQEVVMDRYIKCVCLVALALCVLHPFAAGQEYYFEGYVRDETGSPVQGVELVCEVCDVSSDSPPGCVLVFRHWQ